MWKIRIKRFRKKQSSQIIKFSKSDYNKKNIEILHSQQ